MRSQGQIRFIKVSSRVQIALAGLILCTLLAWMATMAGMAWAQYRASTDRASLIAREAQVATTAEQVDAYRDDIDAVAADLARRQEFIEDMVDSLPADIRTQDTAPAATEAGATAAKVSAAVPEAAALARIEARQLAFVERLTAYAVRRADRTAEAIRKLGLDPDTILRGVEAQAMGGPFEKLATGEDGYLDPRFEKLGLSLARMTALERGLDGIPQVAPARVEMVTSSFGVRRDPFTGASAMHKGLDFRGPAGAPIYAAADGRVTFVGRKSGYGKVVEISHGNGLMTRYAHMSKFSAERGQRVEAGAVIGAIGSTGRSTGPHLHFEVRINNRAVNPRPFLETAPDVFEEIRRRPELARR